MYLSLYLPFPQYADFLYNSMTSHMEEIQPHVLKSINHFSDLHILVMLCNEAHNNVAHTVLPA